MQLSSRKELLEESEKTLRGIRKKLHEAVLPFEQIEEKIERYAELSGEIDQVTAHLNKLKTEYNDLNDELLPLMEEVQALGQKAIETKKFLLTIKRSAYERTNTSYKQAFDLALTKVNQKIKDILNETLESTKTITKVSASLGVQRVGEGTLFGTIKDKIKALFAGLKTKFKGANRDVSDLKTLAKKIQ
jgi:septation ring formation regulator EzrA